MRHKGKRSFDNKGENAWYGAEELRMGNKEEQKQRNVRNVYVTALLHLDKC